MNRINWYVFHQLAIGMILFTAGLTTVIWLSSSLKFIEMIVSGGLTTGTFIYMTMLTIPNFLPIIMPIALFGIVIFLYSRMVADRELVVMRTMGMSQTQLAKPAFILGLLVMAFLYAINIYILPQSYKLFGQMKWEGRNIAQMLLQEGKFNQVTSGVTVYVRERAKDGQLLGLFVHDERDPEKTNTWMARKGTLGKAENGMRILLQDGSRHDVDKKTNKFSILYFDRHVIEMDNKQSGMGIRSREARELTLTELFNLEDQPYVSPRDYGKFTVEAHKRILSPLSALTFMIIGLACITSGSFARRNQINRILVAIALVVTLVIGTLALANFVARNTHLIPLLYFNALLPLIGGFLGLVIPQKLRFAKK